MKQYGQLPEDWTLTQFLWLDTGGKSQLKAIPDLNVSISDVLQRIATADDFAAHIDIADWLLRERACHPERSEGSPACHPERSEGSHSIAFLKASKYLSPEVYDQVEAFIDEFDLQFWGAEKVMQQPEFCQ